MLSTEHMASSTVRGTLGELSQKITFFCHFPDEKRRDPPPFVFLVGQHFISARMLDSGDGQVMGVKRFAADGALSAISEGTH